MSLKKGSKFVKGYATVIEDDGVNYREIADIMSEIGFIMNHSSARNYVLRVMAKFAEAFDEEWNLGLTHDNIQAVASSPQFQNAISDLLHNLETAKKTEASF
jgi:hypothetical protein